MAIAIIVPLGTPRSFHVKDAEGNELDQIAVDMAISLEDLATLPTSEFVALYLKPAACMLKNSAREKLAMPRPCPMCDGAKTIVVRERPDAEAPASLEDLKLPSKTVTCLKCKGTGIA